MCHIISHMSHHHLRCQACPNPTQLTLNPEHEAGQPRTRTINLKTLIPNTPQALHPRCRSETLICVTSSTDVSHQHLMCRSEILSPKPQNTANTANADAKGLGHTRWQACQNLGWQLFSILAAGGCVCYAVLAAWLIVDTPEDADPPLTPDIMRPIVRPVGLTAAQARASDSRCGGAAAAAPILSPELPQTPEGKGVSGVPRLRLESEEDTPSRGAPPHSPPRSPSILSGNANVWPALSPRSLRPRDDLYRDYTLKEASRTRAYLLFQVYLVMYAMFGSSTALMLVDIVFNGAPHVSPTMDTVPDNEYQVCVCVCVCVCVYPSFGRTSRPLLTSLVSLLTQIPDPRASEDSGGYVPTNFIGPQGNGTSFYSSYEYPLDVATYS